MKAIKNIGVIFLSLCMTLLIFSSTAYAATGTVSVSSASAIVGRNVTVTCTVNCSSGPIGYANVILTYDQSGLQFVSATKLAQGGNGSVHYVDTGDGSARQLSFQMTFKVLKAGSYKVKTTSVKGSEFVSEDDFTAGNATGTITGKVATSNNNTNNNNNNNNTTQNNKDSNNKLSALQVHPGTLSPAFNAGTTSYNLEVPADTKEVTISATPQSSKATVSVSGGKDLKLGPNTAQVVVVAENGSSIAYTINIMCGEVEKIQIAGAEHTINEEFSDEQIPTGFTRTEVTYNDRQYEALANATCNLQLMNLQSGDSNSFYIYNQEKQEFYNFAQIKISDDKYIILLPLEEGVEEFADHEIATVQVQEKTFDAWKLDEEFSVVYAIDQNGENVLYRYDSVDGLFQRYVEIAAVDQIVEEKTMFPNQYYMYAIVGLGTLVLILSIAMIYFIASRKARHEGRKRKAIKKMEKQKAKEEKQRLKEEAELERIRQKEEAIREKQRLKEEKKLAKQNKKNKEQ